MRNKLENILKGKLCIKYSILSGFLIKMLRFNLFCNIEAHEIPDKIMISKNKNKVYIPHSGNVLDMEIYIEEILRNH